MITTIGVGVQSTLGGTTFLPENMYEKNNKMPEFYMILVRKISKIPEFLWYLAEKIYEIPEFYTIFVRKVPGFYIIIARKMFFFLTIWGGVHVPPVPPGSYAYDFNYLRRW